jgi:hypothetical protein
MWGRQKMRGNVCTHAIGYESSQVEVENTEETTKRSNTKERIVSVVAPFFGLLRVRFSICYN